NRRLSGRQHEPLLEGGKGKGPRSQNWIWYPTPALCQIGRLRVQPSQRAVRRDRSAGRMCLTAPADGGPAGRSLRFATLAIADAWPRARRPPPAARIGGPQMTVPEGR